MLFTHSKITYLYKRKIITLEQHNWILFVKNELEKTIPNLYPPKLFKFSDGIFLLQWHFSDLPEKIVQIVFFAFRPLEMSHPRKL